MESKPKLATVATLSIVGGLVVGVAAALVVEHKFLMGHGPVAEQIHSQSPQWNGGDLEPFLLFEGDPVTIPTVTEITGYMDMARTKAEKVALLRVGPDSMAGDGDVNLKDKIQVFQVLHKVGNDYVDACRKETYPGPYGDNEGQNADFLRSFQGKAVAVRGAWNHDKGTFDDVCSDGQGGTFPCFTLSCVSGAVGKCAHWGYIPQVPYAPELSLSDYHRACVHAARAQYASNPSISYTCEGTLFDIYDRLKIKKRKGSA